MLLQCGKKVLREEKARKKIITSQSAKA